MHANNIESQFLLNGTTCDDLNTLAGLTTLATNAFDSLDDLVITAANLTKYNVFAVQPLTRGSRNKKLASVGVGTAISHERQLSF